MLPYPMRVIQFQSTLPVRGATTLEITNTHDTNISIHAPREGSDQSIFLSILPLPISIHAPREGSDGVLCHVSTLYMISIHAPREGSDQGGGNCQLAVRISIHAPREGSDSGGSEIHSQNQHFNPRSP